MEQSSWGSVTSNTKEQRHFWLHNLKRLTDNQTQSRKKETCVIDILVWMGL